MLKKIFHSLLYGVAVLFTLQYIFVSKISPTTVLTDLKTCINDTTYCQNLKNQSFQGEEFAVLDTVLSTQTQEERKALINSFELDIIDLTNKERLERSIQPLTPQALLHESAKVKVLDMQRRQYFEHDSPDGKGVSDLVKEQGYDFLIVGENLALGDFKTAQSVVDAWMNSQGHRENILNEKYNEIGVSMISGMYKGKQALFIVQHFGTNRSICPAIDQGLKNTIERTIETLRSDEREIEELRDSIESEKNVFSPQYVKNVEAFNALVEKYNKMLESSRNQISRYNEEVRGFNNCLAEYQ